MRYNNKDEFHYVWCNHYDINRSPFTIPGEPRRRPGSNDYSGNDEDKKDDGDQGGDRDKSTKRSRQSLPGAGTVTFLFG